MFGLDRSGIRLLSILRAVPALFLVKQLLDRRRQYGLEPLRLGEVAFVNRKTFTTGVMNAPITVAFT